ncbi:unnamed protein product [Rangifer tarandus platyrhynchus]|uniref:Uncharacterized protein n=1 Tax=Rangifer tarandus platyrhynchus TaxID=3082113 RepID=A0AC59YBL0_RANTA
MAPSTMTVLTDRFGDHTLQMVLCAFGTECAAAAKSLQSCPTLCDPIDGSPPGSPVPGLNCANSNYVTREEDVEVSSTEIFTEVGSSGVGNTVS